MLAAVNRLRTSGDFSAAVRGVRVRSGPIVLHADFAAGSEPARVGFIVSRAVGGAVVRHTVARRLRSAVRPVVGLLPPGTVLVIRAMPESGTTSYAALTNALSRGLDRLLAT